MLWIFHWCSNTGQLGCKNHVSCYMNIFTFYKLKFLTLPEWIVGSPVAVPLQ